MNRDPLNQGAPSGASNSTQQLPRSLSQSQLSSSSSYPPASNSQRSDRTSPTAISSGATYFSPATFATANPTTTAPTPASATTAPMATSALNSFHPFAPMAPSYPSAGPRYPERDTAYTAGASLDGPPFTLIVHGLDANIDKNTLKYMFMALSDLLISYDLLAPEGDGVLTRSAIVQTKTLESAYEVKQLFNNKNGLTVEIPGQGQISGQSSSGASSATSPSAAPTQAPRFESFSPLERTSPPNGNGARNGNSNGFNHGIFSPQSPIGNHLSTQPRMSGKSLIDATDDDDTEDILRATRAHTENGSLFPAPRALFPEYYSAQGARSYGENGLGQTQRRATAPQLPLAAHMASLSLKTSTNGMPTAQHGNQAMYPQSAHSTTMSPTGVNGSLGNAHQSNYPGYERVLPPVNPADQNPPCNTLYVGNLPMDAQEDELRRIFQAARGYKRMCYRSKNNGPMCFVEFEDVGCATRAMNDMYGKTLSNSRKGGIRLSFSKNPLGVRNTPAPGSGSAGSMGGHHGMMGHATNGFAAANGPPPGLHPLPPGLNLNRSASSYAVSAMTNGSSMPMTNGPGLGVMTNGASYAPPTGNGNGNGNGNSLGFALGNGSGYEQRGDQRREPRDTSRDPWPSNYSTNGFASPPAGGANSSGPFSPYGRVPRNSNF